MGCRSGRNSSTTGTADGTSDVDGPTAAPLAAPLRYDVRCSMPCDAVVKDRFGDLKPPVSTDSPPSPSTSGGAWRALTCR
jgi:hypothetical protein